MGEPTLAGYTLVSRRDRRDGRKGGGVAFFAKNEKASSVNLLEHSEDSERSWPDLYLWAFGTDHLRVVK